MQEDKILSSVWTLNILWNIFPHRRNHSEFRKFKHFHKTICVPNFGENQYTQNKHFGLICENKCLWKESFLELAKINAKINKKFLKLVDILCMSSFEIWDLNLDSQFCSVRWFTWNSELAFSFFIMGYFQARAFVWEQR